MQKIYFLFVLAVLALLALAGTITVSGGVKEFSENENRYLTQFPQITWSGILSGDVQSDISDAFNDQFINRDFWTAASTKVEKVLGYKDIGGVYLGKDHYYFEKIMNQDISQTNYFQNLRFLQYIAERETDSRITVMLVPSPGTVLKEKLPDKATLYDADKMYHGAAALLRRNGQDNILLDIRQQMEEAGKEKQIYYKTDHHWSLRGAYIGYRTYTECMGREPEAYENFDVQVVSDSFFGTLYSKVLDSRAVADEMDAPQNLPDISVFCDGEERDSIYDEGKKDEKDKYAYFFGGNYGEVQIINEAVEERKLLIIKDSFANSMVPFFLRDYSEIRMLDMRYFKRSVQDFLEEYRADEILILYEMSNFAQDNNLNKLTK